MTAADYDTDTLTTARSNRIASQRYYHQLIPSRSILSSVGDQPGMLTRSPSGAKRRIKQKRENMARPSPFLAPSPSSSMSISPVPDDSSSYRSLMDSGALQSILPEMPKPPQPAPRMHSTLSASTSALDATHTAVPAHSKPTVEVHPMPVDEPKPREKPPVPIKPKGLFVDHMNRSTSLNSLASPNGMNTTTSAFLSNLVASPSLLSLQQAYKNPDLGSQELRSLEDRRIESISTVSHRLSNFEEKRLSIEEQAAQNERLGIDILDAVQLHDPLLASRIRRHLENSWDLLRLDTKLRCQMDKLVECLKTGAGDKSEVHFEESRLRRRLSDVGLLRTTFQRREMDIEKSLQRFLNKEDIRLWQTYVDRAARLIRDEKTVDGRIEDSRIHLRALHMTRQSN